MCYRFLIISDIISLLMIKIMSAMNLCVLLNYHITCPFPAAQIRFPAEVDPDLICC
ncbi:hypothetical protein EC12264_A0031 [Escherichia coli 1.2264]|nr:hypothetical protein EC12264_A0031 [Escherichia coli 1.2264]EII23478.1 hypothetical protein EC90111_A0169 [Escherichia coli 9.0111]